MSEPGAQDVAELQAGGGIAPAEVQRELASIWKALRSDPGLRREAELAGVDPAWLQSAEVPLQAGRNEAQFGVAETILISVAGGVLTHVAKQAVDVLWERVFWPRLKQRFGADLKASGNAG
ncbi:hypothetical protein E0493_18470 [Roseomonas sp. M0104]|uniref:Uncharacterized protein n=1 Tax=Teichococcus coralli TaxID=2545983 RepID=A0A845BGT7_9PROT|nr:hypothetical protein [Pseudoroseomonas coralli]MXP65336.1 hypothetical protein [Pseudoroseomonas coralli]